MTMTPQRQPLPSLCRHPQALDLSSISSTKRHCRVVPCSAVDGSGLLEGFDFVVGDISSRIYLFS